MEAELDAIRRSLRLPPGHFLDCTRSYGTGITAGADDSAA
jgi:hypothetical protein